MPLPPEVLGLGKQQPLQFAAVLFGALAAMGSAQVDDSDRDDLDEAGVFRSGTRLAWFRILLRQVLGSLYIYVYTHIYTHTYVLTCMQLIVYLANYPTNELTNQQTKDMYTCIYIDVHVYMYVFRCTYIYIYIHMY